MRAILPRTPGRTPAANTAPALFPTGEIVGRYQVEAVIGLGGTGTVFRCLDRETGRHVAVKAIPHDATLRRRAAREVEVARRLDHPNVVRLLDSARDDDYIYVVSELVDGGDLGASMRGGVLGDAALLRAVSATCAGLAHAHAAGIVHRDVKPANILLGGDGTVQLADFGIAMLVGPDATVDDRLLGTLSYMAPEICTGGTPTPAADIWSIGVMLYEAMTGANPYRSRSPAELADRHGERPRPLAEVRPDLGRPLTTACARAMSRDPRRRPSAASLATVLEAAADRLEAPGSARVHELHPRPARGARRIPVPHLPRPSLRLPHLPRPSLRLPHLSLDRGLVAGASSLRVSGISAPLAERGCAIARRVGPGVAAAVAVEAVLRAFPFWPASLTTPIAILCGGLAIVAPWSAAVLVLAVCVPALGNLSSALAWAFALVGALWLSASAGSGRRALLPLLAPAALALLVFPVYLIAAGRLRSVPGRALAGAAGPVAIALWAAHTSASTYTGTDDVAAVLRALVHGAGAPLVGQALAWGAVAMAWPLAWSGWRIGRAAGAHDLVRARPGRSGGRARGARGCPRGRAPQRRRGRSRCYPPGPERAGPRRRDMSRVSPARAPSMGFLRSIESGIERVVDGTVGRVVRVSVQPVEIARKLAKELEDGKVQSGSRTFVPSLYTVYLPPKDRERFAEYEASLRVELGAYLAEHVRREGYSVLARPRVTFETAEELAPGTFGIATERESLAAAGPLSTLPVDAIAEAPPIAIPEPYVPEPSVPEPSVPEPYVPEPYVLEPSVPEPYVPEPYVLEPSVPEPYVPEPYVLEPSVPASEPAQEALPDVLPEPEPEPVLDPEPAGEEPGPSLPDPGLPLPPPVVPDVSVPAPPPIAPPAPFLPVPTPPAPDPVPDPPAASPFPEPLPEIAPEPIEATQSVSAAEAARAGLAHATDALVVDGHRHLLTGPVTVIGRSSACDLPLDDASASRRHAELRRRGANTVLVDLDSTNGTLVNGRRVREAPLRAGDRITIGTTTIVFERAS